MDNTERNLQNALDAAKRRLQDLEYKYKTDVTTQDKDFLEEDIEIEKANVAALEEKLEEIRKDKVDKIKDRFDEYKKFKQEKWLQENKVNIYINNFEYAVVSLLLNLHNENMCILNTLIGNEDTSKIRKYYIDDINKIFKEYFGIDLRT